MVVLSLLLLGRFGFGSVDLGCCCLVVDDENELLVDSVSEFVGSPIYGSSVDQTETDQLVMSLYSFRERKRGNGMG